VDFTANEEEQNAVGADDQKPRDEERQEASQIVRDPALLGIRGDNWSIFLSRSHTNNEASRQSPAKYVIVFLEELGFTVTTHDHLVEIEGDTKGPTEVRNEEEVHENRNRYTPSLTCCHLRFRCANKGRETDDNTNT